MQSKTARKCRRHHGRLETVSPDVHFRRDDCSRNYFFFFTAFLAGDFLAAGFLAFLAGFLAITLFVVGLLTSGIVSFSGAFTSCKASWRL